MTAGLLYNAFNTLKHGDLCGPGASCPRAPLGGHSDHREPTLFCVQVKLELSANNTLLLFDFFILRNEIANEMEQTYMLNKSKCPSMPGLYPWKTIITAGAKSRYQTMYARTFWSSHLRPGLKVAFLPGRIRFHLIRQ